MNTKQEQKLSVIDKEGDRKEAKRDIVEFVKMEHVEGEDGEVVASKEELAREALKKIPSQVKKLKCLIDKNRIYIHVLPFSAIFSLLLSKI